jgi:hypothetical protein
MWPCRRDDFVGSHAVSALGQGRLWPAGGWHSGLTPAPEIPRADRHLRFVPQATPAAPKQGGRRVLWPRNRMRESRLLRTPSLPKWLRRVPVELLRMRRTDSQLALEYYQAATSGPVAHGATPETCGGATLTWPAVEFAFGPSVVDRHRPLFANHAHEIAPRRERIRHRLPRGSR